MGGVDHVGHHFEQDGMTLRDYFAADAPIYLVDAQQSLAQDGQSEVTYAQLYMRLAKMRLAYADAMLKARQP
jgi:hypothetical protein